MKTIPLRGEKAAGRVALVDDEDYDLVMQHKWRVQVGSAPIGRPPVVYARTSIGRKTLGMHQMLTGYMQTDHANGNGLDNQRHNLRPATQTQNRFNTPGRMSRESSPFTVTEDVNAPSPTRTAWSRGASPRC